MYQGLPSCLGVLVVKAPEARKLNSDFIIDHFADLKACKAAMW